MKKAYFFMCMFVGLLLMSGCSKDEEGQQTTKNEVIYDGKSFNIIAARMEDISSQGEVTSIPIDLYLNEDGSECLSVEVQREDIGKQVDLTDMNSLYRITFDYDGKHYSWFRTSDMRSAYNLQSGSKASITRMSNGKYSVSVSLSYTIGIAEKRLTAHYEGTVLNNWVDK